MDFVKTESGLYVPAEKEPEPPPAPKFRIQCEGCRDVLEADAVPFILNRELRTKAGTWKRPNWTCKHEAGWFCPRCDEARIAGCSVCGESCEYT